MVSQLARISDVAVFDLCLGVRERYDRELREMSKLLSRYVKFRKLGISFKDLIKHKSEIIREPWLDDSLTGSRPKTCSGDDKRSVAFVVPDAEIYLCVNYQQLMPACVRLGLES